MTQIIEVVERYEIPDFPDIDLPAEDGIPLDSNWHRIQINLLIDVVRHRWRDRRDFFAGGNMFVYYSVQQARNRDYKGPDFFVVKGIDGSYPRQKWVVWEEDGRYPDVIIELLSPSTAAEDLGSKKTLYERTLRTPEYFCYSPEDEQLWGWRLTNGNGPYVPLVPDENGRLYSKTLDAWLGTWAGVYQEEDDIWLRLFDQDGRLVPSATEAAEDEAYAAWEWAKEERQRAEVEQQRAEVERQRAEEAVRLAEAERRRAEAAEAELSSLRQELARLKGST